ncbi:acyltransferase [Oculatella sp. LEGE 06141]|uniref:acyltransferase n=1 Tax=Oculatella sp. LEGE 06141 TaxID=1828648 RepID=UPI00187E579A|nr:acyltransferase [Oculatella sp. LEGE 06141]MBE9177118.1 acyltransferase [Oculatella sp. LEGE 06141]
MNEQTNHSPSVWSRRWETIAIALLGWMPLSIGKKLRQLVYPTILAKLGSAVDIAPGVELIQAKGIEMGNNIRLHRDVRIMSLGQNSTIRLKNLAHLDRGVDIRTHHSGEIEVGENSYIGPYTCLSGDLIKVGNNCMVASHAGLYANNHNFDDPDRLICQQGSSYKGIVIEDDCWLGSGVRVLDGVTIGRGSVVGAGAVVTRDIPPYSIAVGVPAKVVSQRNGRRTESKETTLNLITDPAKVAEDLNCSATLTPADLNYRTFL